MITILQRPLTAKELKVLAPRTYGLSEFENDFSGALLLIMVLLAPSAWLLQWFGLKRWTGVVAIAAIALGVGTAVRMRLRLRGLASEGVSRRAKELRDGLAHEVVYDVAEAIRIEETEDLGSNYYLHLTDGTVVFLSGQYLYEDEEAGRFPSTRIRRTIAPLTNELLDFACLGTPLNVSSTHPAFTDSDYRTGRVPEDGAVVTRQFWQTR